MTDQTDTGIIFAATGATYVTLARRAARSVKRVMPDVPIDLYTDRRVSDDVFDQVVRLKKRSYRPKIEALKRSRFRKSLYLDCDIIAIAPVGDVFELLDKYEIAACHENYRNGRNIDRVDCIDLPASFPEFNSGFLGVRRTDKTDALLMEWDERVHARHGEWDQPHLRRLLYEGDLSIGVLPHDYNLMHTAFIQHMGRFMTAPRLLHLPKIHEEGRDPGAADMPFEVEEYLSEKIAGKLKAMLENDKTLAENRTPRDPQNLPKPVPPRLRHKIRRFFRL